MEEINHKKVILIGVKDPCKVLNLKISERLNR